MKQCPVCKENFADEFSFCDLDGTQLDGDSKAAVTGGSSGTSGKLWPIVGVVLVLGALATVVGSIVFFPRALSAPPPANQPQAGFSKSGSGTSYSTSTDATQTANAAPPSDTLDDVKSTKSTEPADPSAVGLHQNGKKNAGHDPNTSDVSLDPKSAVQPASDLQPVDVSNDDRSRTLNTPATGTETKPPARESATPAGDASAAGTTGSGTTGTQVKHRAAKTDTAAADGDDTTVSRNGKKKKGGFLKIFKKIFGQG